MPVHGENVPDQTPPSHSYLCGFFKYPYKYNMQMSCPEMILRVIGRVQTDRALQSFFILMQAEGKNGVHPVIYHVTVLPAFRGA